MKEIGGYFEFERFEGKMLHEDSVALNCGRNALAYLIIARGIKKIQLPYFLCDSVRNVCLKYGVTVRYYRVGSDFLPQPLPLEEDEWLYVVNYYGQLSAQILRNLAQVYPRLITDNAQAYFEGPVSGIDTIYTCRKFFGVSDGAFLYTDSLLKEELPVDESFERMRFVLGRFERNASEFYGDASANNRFFADEPIKRMSKLTENLLHAIDYQKVKEIRTLNFAFLHERLKKINQISVHPVEGAFMYPLMVENADEIKKQMLAQRIYIPTLWPNVVNELDKSWTEWKMAKNVLPLPCDQRYCQEDFGRLLSVFSEQQP